MFVIELSIIPRVNLSENDYDARHLFNNQPVDDNSTLKLQHEKSVKV